MRRGLKVTARFAVSAVIAAAALLYACMPASAVRTSYSFGDSQLLIQIEEVSRNFARRLERVIFSEGFMRVESREALDRMVHWINDNEYPRIREFLDVLSFEDAQTLFDCFKRDGVAVGSAPFSPVVEPFEVTGQRTALTFPFSGVFYIVQGNGGSISHFKDSKNEFAWDFLVMKDGFMYKGATHKNENYHAWGLPALAPAPGVVLKTRNDQPDHRPMTTKMDGANYVIIEHENREVSLIYHLMEGSIMVKVGDRVERGRQVGRIGDSGISMFPHIHYQLDAGPEDNRKPLPAKFVCYFAKLDTEPDWRLVVSGAPRLKEYIISIDDYLDEAARPR